MCCSALFSVRLNRQRKNTMIRRRLFTLLLPGGWIGMGPSLLASGGPPRDNVIDEDRLSDGYDQERCTPRAYTLNTEKLGPIEMRINTLDTSMPNLLLRVAVLGIMLLLAAR